MSDLISRQAAIDALEGCYCGGEDSCGEPWIYESHAIKAIKQLPPIQPKPLQPWEVLVAQAVLPQPDIVRCKDCKNYKFGMCLYSMTSGVGKLPNGFCDWAERREVNHESN